jgi:acyl-CoA reductase-like NAD-dependent aldehyde dehydrogenase
LLELSMLKIRSINRDDWQRQSHFGGQSDESDCYIAPTLIDESDVDSLIMKDEIFGPLLPILEYSSDADIHAVISKWETIVFYIYFYWE